MGSLKSRWAVKVVPFVIATSLTPIIALAVIVWIYGMNHLQYRSFENKFGLLTIVFSSYFAILSATSWRARIAYAMTAVVWSTFIWVFLGVTVGCLVSGICI
jgi:hypothetical protein